MVEVIAAHLIFPCGLKVRLLTDAPLLSITNPDVRRMTQIAGMEILFSVGPGPTNVL